MTQQEGVPQKRPDRNGLEASELYQSAFSMVPGRSQTDAAECQSASLQAALFITILTALSARLNASDVCSKDS